MRYVTQSRWWRSRYPSWSAPVLGDALERDFGRVLWSRGRFTVHRRAPWLLAAIGGDDALLVIAGVTVHQAALIVPVLIATSWAFLVAPGGHEFVHAFVARRRGYTIVRFGLTGGGAFVAVNPPDGSSRPADAVAILLAGPLADLAWGVALVLAAAGGKHRRSLVTFLVVAGGLQAANGLANLAPLARTDGHRTRVALAFARQPRHPLTD